MGLFVLKASNSVIDRLKAALANLKLDERLSGNNKNYLVSDFAIPYLESVIKDLEGDAPKKRPLSDCVPDAFKLPSTFCETGEEIDPHYLDDIKQGKHLTSFGMSQEDVDSLSESSKVPEPFDWEGLRERLVQKGMKFSTMTAEMPKELLPSIVQSVTSGMEPRFHKIFKDSK